MRIRVLLFLLCLLAPGSGRIADAADGDRVTSPAIRIITLSPNLTESVFALGRGGWVVGVSDFCQYPPEATTRRRCGGWANPNFEAMAALEPDLVILLGKHEKVSRFCEERDVDVLNVDMDDVDSIKSGLMTLGRRLRAVRRAEALCAQIDRDLEALRARPAPDALLPKVFIGLSRTAGSLRELFTVGKDTLLDDLVRLLGYENCFGDVNQRYPQASKEALIARRPDIILEFRPGENLDAADRERLRADWAPLSSIPAVYEKRIAFVTAGQTLISGPRVAEIALIMKQALERATVKERAE